MPLIEKIFILTMFAQALIAFVLVLRMRYARVKAYKEGGISMADVAIDPSVWPLKVRQVQNCYSNQFEMPVLFYTACLLAYHVGAVDWVMTILALAYVAIRWVHMFIHTGSNNVPKRMKVFALSVLALFVMWVWLVLHVLIFI